MPIPAPVLSFVVSAIVFTSFLIATANRYKDPINLNTRNITRIMTIAPPIPLGTGIKLSIKFTKNKKISIPRISSISPMMYHLLLRK